jgi:nitrogenase molybdenum-cofactor synthesis protein NifE
MNKIEKIAFDQPGCSHNNSAGKKCLHKPSGGESCAFDGAYIVLNPIRDTAHLVHGGITCGSHNYESRGAYSSGSRLYKYCFTTDLNETDIVFGSEEKLKKAIIEIKDKFSPSAIFVYQTCIPGMTGEDTEKICSILAEELKTPVIPVISPGFFGHKNLGNRIAGEALLKYVIGTGSEKKESDISVNIIGEYNIAGDIWNILPLFEKIGITIQAKITGDADYLEITNAHNASLNLLVCSRALINIAMSMQEKYHIDYQEVSFFGIYNTTSALKGVIEYFYNKNKLSIEQYNHAIYLILKMEKNTHDRLKTFYKVLKGKRAVIYSGGVKSWSMITALMDLGIDVTAVGTKKSSQSDLEKIENIIGKEKMIEDTTPKSLLETIRKTSADFLIAGSRNQYLAYKEKIPYIDINQERHTSYGGYEGAIHMAMDLCNSIQSPVWNAVKSPAPWEKVGVI